MRRLLWCVLLGACSTATTSTPSSELGPAVRIVVIDVGQGDASLIIGTDGTVVLFDGGGLGQAETIRNAITRETGGRVDHVVISHYDADHLAGVADYLLGSDRQPGTSDDGAPNARIWDYGDDGECGSQTCDRYRLSRTGRTTEIQPGDVIGLGEAQLRCVAVNGKVSGGATVPPTDENSRSVSLLLEHGDFKALIAGDLTGGGDGTANVEPAVASVTGILDLLKVNHHGSKTSSNADALSSWAPRAGIISVGTDNSYCHPAPEVLTRLAATGMRLYATGQGIVHADARCSVTPWPEDARRGFGDITVTAYRDRTMFIADEEVP